MNLTEEFLDNVKNHKMKILLDNGVYRHLYFRSPETVNRYFEIVTYPGYLVICGDMGTYVFRRLSDMFEFFRHDTVDLDYWSQKIDAEDKNSKVREFSPEKAEKIIRDHINEYFEDGEDEAEKKRVLEEFEDLNFENEDELYRGLNDISADCFQDCWEWGFKEYNFHFTWCCQAIVWAIKQWDSREKV
jgi:hypothetical protein